MQREGTETYLAPQEHEELLHAMLMRIYCNRDDRSLKALCDMKENTNNVYSTCVKDKCCASVDVSGLMQGCLGDCAP